MYIAHVAQLHRHFWLTVYKKLVTVTLYTYGEYSIEHSHRNSFEVRLKFVVFRLAHLGDKTSKEAIYRHFCEYNIELDV
jgi:hypothetical protein